MENLDDQDLDCYLNVYEEICQELKEYGMCKFEYTSESQYLIQIFIIMFVRILEQQHFLKLQQIDETIDAEESVLADESLVCPSCQRAFLQFPDTHTLVCAGHDCRFVYDFGIDVCALRLVDT